MRAAALTLAVLLTAATAGCSPRQSAPTPPAAPAAPAAPAEPAPTPPQAQPDIQPPAPPVPPEAPSAPAPPAAIHFSPADYPARERRISALINNAESRDTSGETQYLAEQARSQRARCTTKACIERSYAAEEARLRKWEGSSDIK
jgi:outer membrane biosynthesis protein TonB